MGSLVACFSLNGKVKISNAALVTVNSWSKKETYVAGVRVHIQMAIINKAVQFAIGLELIRRLHYAPGASFHFIPVLQSWWYAVSMISCLQISEFLWIGGFFKSIQVCSCLSDLSIHVPSLYEVAYGTPACVAQL